MNRIKYGLFALLLLAMSVASIGVSSDTARATSIYDNIIQVDSELTLNGNDVTATWASDLRAYSDAHPANTYLSDSLAILDTNMATGSGWSIFKSTNDLVGGGGTATLILSDPSAPWEFIEQSNGHAALGILTTYDFRAVNFYYNSSGVLQGAFLAGDGSPGWFGTYTDASTSLTYRGFDSSYFGATYYPEYATRTLSINSPINYPSGYGGVVLPEGKEYVAMGDSFSSGEGNPSFESGTDTGSPDENRCHRSPKAYPRLLQLDSSLNLGSTKFVACSGATTDTMINGGSGAGAWGEDPQVDSLSEDTEVVTITIGGNDVEFADYAYACTITLCGPGTFDYAYIMDAINDSDFYDNLVQTYETILDQAPNAQVYVADYPYLAVEDSDVCGQTDLTGAWAVQSQLDAVIEDAVNDVITSNLNLNIHYVDTNQTGSPFIGKHLCNGGASDFNSLVGFPNTGYSFHPNESGQQHYATVFKADM